jgi:hypothetical protein
VPWSELPLHPEERTLRQFAVLWVFFFLGLATWQARQHDRWTLAAILTALALTGGTVGLVRPQTLRPIFVGWLVAVSPLGWVVSHLLLALLFYVVFTPVGLCLRLTGRDPLGLRFRPGRTTYWEPRPPVQEVSAYFRQS